jgi:hypothetical protein
MPYSSCPASLCESPDCGPRARCVPDRRAVRFAPDALSSRRAILSRAAPLRGAAGAPAAGLCVGEARPARARPTPRQTPKINYGRPADDRVLLGRLLRLDCQLAATRGTGWWSPPWSSCPRMPVEMTTFRRSLTPP